MFLFMILVCLTGRMMMKMITVVMSMKFCKKYLDMDNSVEQKKSIFSKEQYPLGRVEPNNITIASLS